jgi:hypothetical protein
MKHWKETVLKSGHIKWERPPIKNIEDGKLDILVTIRLTSLFESQAKYSYSEGIRTMMELLIQSQTQKRVIKVTDIVKMLNDCGFPELAKEIH